MEALQRAHDVRQEHEGCAAEDPVEALVVELELLSVVGNELVECALCWPCFARWTDLLRTLARQGMGLANGIGVQR